MNRPPRMLAVALAFIAAAAPLPGRAQSAEACAEGPRADAIAEPWEANSATYAEGRVRVALIDTIEPAAAAFHLLILTPPLDEVGGRRCRLVSLAPGSGFFAVDFAARRASYDPARGLVLAVPVQLYDPATGGGRAAGLTVTVDQRDGEVTAALRE